MRPVAPPSQMCRVVAFRISRTIPRTSFHVCKVRCASGALANGAHGSTVVEARFVLRLTKWARAISQCRFKQRARRRKTSLHVPLSVAYATLWAEPLEL